MYRLLLSIFSLCFISLNAQTKYNAEAGNRLLISDGHIVPALILTDKNCSDSGLASKGILVNSKAGSVWSVAIPLALIQNKSSINGVLYVEATTYTNALRCKNDKEKQLTHVDKVQNGLQNSLPKNYSGKGVIVGIVDVGFQCNNPTFYTADSCRYRVSRYWKQADKSGTAPQGFQYGSEYSDTALIQTLNDMDGSHGTHVAGIAAGSGLSTPNLQYRGMAPGAELVFVTIKYSNDTLAGSAMGDYIVANPSIIDAYNYIFNYAQSVGKPAVINLSWGMHTGPHDGSSLFDLATESLVGKGKILVGANGNEGDNPMHWSHNFDRDTVGTILIENNRQFNTSESVYCDFWGSRKSHFSLKIQIVDTNARVIVETPFIATSKDTAISYNLYADTSNFGIHFKTLSNYIPNGKPNLTVWVEQPKQRKYAILAYICSDSSQVHGWNSGAARAWTSGSFRSTLNKLNFGSKFIAGNSDYTAGENGGTSKAVISVGALAARSAYINQFGKLINDSGYVLPPEAVRFSSMGPTVDGRVKPEISAPGFDVPSSNNNKQIEAWMEERTLLKTVFRNDTQYWTAFSGTSMASPHVTGIVALLLEANPDLDPTALRDILETTATTASYMGNLPNFKYGYGQVDAYSALIKTLQFSGVNALNRGNGLRYFPNPVNNIVEVENMSPNSKLTLMDNTGRTLEIPMVFDPSSGHAELDLSALDTGIYLLCYYSGGEIFAYRLQKN